MIHFIYKITNNINNKRYIGKTKFLKARFTRHCSGQTKSYISNAIQKYGKDNFILEILDIIQFIEPPSKEDIIKYVNSREIYFIDKYKSYTEGYNCTIGGDGGTMSSELARKIQLDRVKAGSHPFLDKAKASQRAIKRINEGTHNFSGELSSKTQVARVKAGTHHFTSELSIKTNKDKLEKGTHNFSGERGSILQKELNRNRLEAGTHSSQKDHTCNICLKVGKGNSMLGHIRRCNTKDSFEFELEKAN